MRIDLDKALMAIGLMLEGMSVRACERIVGINRDTLCDLVLQVGWNCERFLKVNVRDVRAPEIHMDEMHSFVRCSAKTAREKKVEGGAVWTWFAIDADSKAVLAHFVGHRNKISCEQFLEKLNGAFIGETQITTDRLCFYSDSIVSILGGRAEHVPGLKANYSERFNLTVRMHVRRFARQTNAHSKSMRHHRAAIAMFVAWYNFCRLNSGSSEQGKEAVTPAVAAGLAGRQWTITELLRAAADTSENDPSDEPIGIPVGAENWDGIPY